MKTLITAMLLVFSASAAAQAPPSAGAAKAPTKKKKRPGVIQIKALKVEGVIQKPEAFYILQRSELNFKGLEPQKSFIPLILKSVEKDPF